MSLLSLSSPMRVVNCENVCTLSESRVRSIGNAHWRIRDIRETYRETTFVVASCVCESTSLTTAKETGIMMQGGMEHVELLQGGLQPSEAVLRYEMRGMGYTPEDILLCVDADAEVNVEMKAGGGVKGLSRLDAVKQALVLFVHSKLLIHPQHRFAVATLRNNVVWHRREFTNDMEVIGQAVRGLASGGTFPHCDLSELFQIAAAEAHSSHALDRTLRVVLIYCRSSVVPEVTLKLPEKQHPFTFDALYLHDKPSHDNCPQRVYDVLVDALERVSEFEGYIFESGSGSARVLFRHMCVLLSHPQQRCAQDEFDAPKDLAKMVAPVHRTSSSGLPQLRKEGEE